MSYYEAARKVRMQGEEPTQLPKEKLYEAPWIPWEGTQLVIGTMAVVMSYYEAARKVRMQGEESTRLPKEKLYEAPWIPWEGIYAVTRTIGAMEICHAAP